MKVDKPIFSEEQKDFVLQQIYVAADCLYQCARDACQNGNPFIVAGIMREHDALLVKASKIGRLLDV